MAENNKTGFWTNVFHSQPVDLLSVGSFIVCLSIFFAILGGGVYFFINKYLGAGIEVVETTKEGNIKIFFGSGKRNTTVIVDVPGSVFGIPSGVPLEKNKEIKITASGVVLTDAAGYFKNSPKKKDDLLDKLNSRIIGWRDPDGVRVNFMDEESEKKITRDRGEKDVAAKSADLKLLKSAQYGCLLGIVSVVALDKNNLENIDSLIRNMKAKVFKLGGKSTITFEDGQFIVYNYDADNRLVGRDSLDKQYAGCNIYFR